MKIRFNPLFLLLFFFITLVSCDKNVVFEENVKLPQNTWDANNIIILKTEIQDTLSPLNLYINVRNASGYQFSNLFLFFTTNTPDSSVARDTVELRLADDNGKWLGTGLGDIWDNRFLFKRNFRFPRSGVYTFELQQAMRLDKLPQITDAGIRIELAK